MLLSRLGNLQANHCFSRNDRHVSVCSRFQDSFRILRSHYSLCGCSLRNHASRHRTSLSLCLPHSGFGFFCVGILNNNSLALTNNTRFLFTFSLLSLRNSCLRSLDFWLGFCGCDFSFLGAWLTRLLLLGGCFSLCFSLGGHITHHNLTNFFILGRAFLVDFIRLTFVVFLQCVDILHLSLYTID